MCFLQPTPLPLLFIFSELDVSSIGKHNSSVDEEAQVDAGETSYHIVHIVPTNN